MKPEYSVGEQRVDYALRIANSNNVFVEVKKANEDLQDHQLQLLNYSFKEGVKLAALTNGLTWWFYLPLHEGSWEQRKFYTIDILEQPTQDVMSRFTDLLAREHIMSGSAYERAEKIYAGQRNLQVLKETMMKTWNKIVSEADESLIELLNETTEKLCGLKPEAHLAEEFLVKHRDKLLLPEIPEGPKGKEKVVPSFRGREQVNVSGKTIKGFWFKSKRYEVESWKDLLLEFSHIVSDLQGKNFEKVLSLGGRKRPWFTRDKNEIRAPARVGDTDIYVETNMSANFIMKTCKEMLAISGYPASDLTVETT